MIHKFHTLIKYVTVDFICFMIKLYTIFTGSIYIVQHSECNIGNVTCIFPTENTIFFL